MLQVIAALLAFCSASAWAGELTSELLLVQASPSLVLVQGVDGRTGTRRTGSGVVVRSKQVITSCSLIMGWAGYEIISAGQSFPSTLLIADQQKNLCLLAAEGLPAPPVQRGSTADLTMQMSVRVIRQSGSGAAALEAAVVTQLRGGKPPLIKTTAEGGLESVGGALFDREGRCVGITTLFKEEGQEISFAAPVEWLDQLESEPTGGNGRHIHWLKRAIALEEANKWEALLDWSKQWAASLPADVSAWHTLGYACIVLKKLDQALAAFLHTVQIDPGDIDGWSNLGYVYTDLQRYPDAIRAYREVVRISPSDVDGWSNLVLSYEYSGNRAEAIKAVDEVNRLDATKAQELRFYLEPLGLREDFYN